MFRRRSVIAGLLVLTLAILSASLFPACRKSSNSFNAPVAESAKPLTEKVAEKPEFADGDEWLINNFNRALGELNALGEACAQEDWDSAGQHYKIFRQETRVPPQPRLSNPFISLALLDLFDLYNVQLEQSIADEDVEQVSFATNQLTNILNDFIAQLQADNNTTEVRRELRRIIFLHREMQLWSERGNEAMLKVRAARLHDAWTDLRPVIFDHNGQQAAEQFDAIANRLDKIETIDDYQDIAGDLNDAVTAVAAVFTGRQ